MQVITLFAGHAHLIALDGGLDLELRVLDQFHHLARRLYVDAVVDADHLAHHIAAGLLMRPEIESLGLDLAAHDLGYEHVLDGAKLHVVLGEDVDLTLFAVEFDARLGAPEIESGADLLLHLIDRVVHLLHVDPADYVKRWHRFLLVRALRHCCSTCRGNRIPQCLGPPARDGASGTTTSAARPGSSTGLPCRDTG